MIRSYKNKEFISQLNTKELKDYYDCYTHHHGSRHSCQENKQSTVKDENCPCVDDVDHFCTGQKDLCSCFQASLRNRDDKCSATNEHSLIVCENYSPSYTSKNDQIKTLKKEVSQIRKSKQLLKKAMQDLDKLLNEDNENQDDDLDEVEKFYRSNKFIGSSMNIKSLNKNLPRLDIKPAKYVHNQNVNSHKTYPEFGTSLFSYYDKNIFADKEILEKEAALRPSRPKSSAKSRINNFRAQSALSFNRHV